MGPGYPLQAVECRMLDDMVVLWELLGTGGTGRTSRDESGRIGTGRVGSGRVGTDRDGSGRVGTGRDGSGRVGTGRFGSARVGTGGTGGTARHPHHRRAASVTQTALGC